MKRLFPFLFLVAYFFALSSSSFSAETVIAPNFAVGSLQGIADNNNSTPSFFVADDSKLYIANSSWQLRSSYTLGSGLSDITFQNSNRSAYVLTSAGQVYEFSLDSKKVTNTLSVPFTTTDQFVGITKAGGYFYVATTHQILQLSLQNSRSKKSLVLKNYWDAGEINFSGVDYTSSENKIYFSDNTSNTIRLVNLDSLTAATTGSTLDASIFENYLTPSTNTTGLCIVGENLIFAENTGRLVQEPMAVLFSDKRQDELAGVNSGGGGNGIPFGYWGLNGYISAEGLADVHARLGATIFQVASSSPNYTITSLLPLVRDAGMKVTLRMTRSHDDYTTNNNFDLDKWKAQIELWQNSGVQEFIDDGTLVGHMILDDIDTFSGTDPTAAELDEMARYSQEIMPGLMTFVRQKATRVPVPTSGYYDYLDACVNQYTNYQGYSDGDVYEYAIEQVEIAASLGLGIINGLNIADGGDGSSGQRGWSSNNKYAMSAEEITTYGEALLSVPDVMMFLMWEYDGEESWSDGTIGSDYFDEAEMQAALYGLSEIAAQY